MDASEKEKECQIYRKAATYYVKLVIVCSNAEITDQNESGFCHRIRIKDC